MKTIQLTLIILLFYLIATTSLLAQWNQLGTDINGSIFGGQFGASVALSSNGQYLAIGSYSNDEVAEDAGLVRVFMDNGGDWTQIGQNIYGLAEGDHAGFQVDISSDGKRIVVPARHHDGR